MWGNLMMQYLGSVGLVADIESSLNNPADPPANKPPQPQPQKRGRKKHKHTHLHAFAWEVSHCLPNF